MEDNQGNYSQEWNGCTENIPDEYRLSGETDTAIQEQAAELMEQAEQLQAMKSMSI